MKGSAILTLFKGCATALITPFKDGKIDYVSMGKIIENQIKEKEADRILAHVKEEACVVTLEIKGKQLDSVAFSEWIEQKTLHGVSHIQFIIGGSLGLHSKVSNISNFKLSFSEMTFPHQLMRVILTEQIYRAFRIMSNGPYHK